MARTKAKKDEMTTETEAKLKPVRLDLPPEIHRLLRLAAADSEISMASYARDVLVTHLKALPRKGSK